MTRSNPGPTLQALVSSRLRADDHVRRCPTCAQLAHPVADRRDDIAAWLLIP